MKDGEIGDGCWIQQQNRTENDWALVIKENIKD